MSRNTHQDLEKLASAFFDNLVISDSEFGAIGVDSKKPFGNSCAVGDILRIIGWEEDDEISSLAREAYAQELYHEKLIPFLQSTWELRLRRMIWQRIKILPSMIMKMDTI